MLVWLSALFSYDIIPITMSILEIRKYPDPILKSIADPVEKFDDQLAKLIDQMIETMYHESGIGLAAPQIGVAQRIIVLDTSRSASSPMHFINPKIIEASKVKVASEEGCLSIPDFRETIKRHEEVTIAALDKHGSPVELKADGLLAICLQHEIDHINGVLFVDHLSRLKRELFRRWFKRNLATAASSNGSAL